MKTFAAILILVITIPFWLPVVCIIVPAFIILGMATGIAVLMEWAWNVLDAPRKPAPKRYERML